jgi:hypothetical protein
MTAVVIVLAVAGAAMPIIGAVGLYRAVRGEAARRRALATDRGHAEPTFADFNEMVRAYWNLDETLRGARRDLVLVSAGFVLTAAATTLGAFA